MAYERRFVMLNLIQHDKFSFQRLYPVGDNCQFYSYRAGVTYVQELVMHNAKNLSVAHQKSQALFETVPGFF